MTVAEAKKILGDTASGMGDDEIAAWLDLMRRLACIECDRFVSIKKNLNRKRKQNMVGINESA